MANRTDPLISQVSGSDPQNLMEYLTRQRIYDSRYWKETCFGLTVEHVLEESTKASKREGCIALGHLQFLALTLKLLQLHPDTELVVEGFVEQAQFKYTRALGALYLRLTGRPADIYTSLETHLYPDARQLRQYHANAAGDAPRYSFVHMDEWGHALLTEPQVAGIALPRLPQRAALCDAGYLPEGPRPTALAEALETHGGPLAYLKYKALTEQVPEAVAMWKDKYEALDPESKQKKMQEGQPSKPKKARRTNKLFKDDDKDDNDKPDNTAAKNAPPEEGSEDYWNEQRAKLGLAPLRK